MWNIKCFVILVIIGAMVIVIKRLEIIPGKHSTDPFTKKKTLGTSHIIRKVLQSEA
jgi:hypothetical protein